MFTKELRVSIVMHDCVSVLFTANTSFAHYCHDNGLLLDVHSAMHIVVDRQKNHGMHFPILAKDCLIRIHRHEGKKYGEGQCQQLTGSRICSYKNRGSRRLRTMVPAPRCNTSGTSISCQIRFFLGQKGMDESLPFK